MKNTVQTGRSISSFFSLLLFGVFTLLLLLLLLFSAKTYRSSVKGLDENKNLHTAMTYVTTKLRQHEETSVFLGTFHGYEALCLQDEIDGHSFITYIYLYNKELKELFTTPEASVSPEIGITIAHLSSFYIEETDNGFLSLEMIDVDGNSSELLFHLSLPA